MKQFVLKPTSGEDAIAIKVDNEDAHILRSNRWQLRRDGKSIYRNVSGSDRLLAHEILAIRPPENFIVAHKNNNANDYRKENLLIVAKRHEPQ